MARRARLHLVTAGLLAVAAAGCGSTPADELPAPAAPGDRLQTVRVEATGLVAELDTRDRRLRLKDPRTGEELASQPAGVGPARIATEADRLYVTDVRLDALLVFQTRPELRLNRHVGLPGGPREVEVGPTTNDLYVGLRDARQVLVLGGTGRPTIRTRIDLPFAPEALSPTADERLLVRGAGAALADLGPAQLAGEQEP
jgi:hypothetical protein